jgi:hypothetical protein
MKMRARRLSALLLGMAALLPLVSCAKAPGSSGSGLRLVVTMRFNAAVRDSYHYFFLIRNANDSVGQNGPIPVILPPYGGNGFATGKFPSSATAAFTDFVEYNRTDQPLVTDSGYTVYHVPGGIQGDPSRNIYQPRGNPAATTPPNGGNTLQFELDLSQIAPTTGETDPNTGGTPRYLQINLITTTTTPANSINVDNAYAVDALGDQRSGAGSDSFNTFITIDTSQNGKTYAANLSPGPDEPTGDEFPSDRDPANDMMFWSIQITGK